MAGQEVAAREEGRPRARALHGAALALVVAAATLLLFGLAMRRGLNHDEHQFVAGAALVAREGLLPWRDFAWFHVPMQLYLTAPLFALTERLLLAARLLQVAAAAGSFALLAAAALLPAPAAPRARAATGALVILLLITSAAFLHASGRAWNHDLAIFFALAATLAHMRSLRTGEAQAGLWSAGAGLLLGFAIGTRLSFAPLVLPFALAPWLGREKARGRAAQAATLGAGLLLGLAPTLLTATLDPGAAWFGNVRYAQLNTAWYRALSPPVGGLSLPGKLLDAASSLLQPANLPLLLFCGVGLWLQRRSLRRADAVDLRFWLLLLPFLAIGALAPTPMQMQYLYVLFPFLALGQILLLQRATRPALLPWMAAAALITAVFAVPRYAEGLAILLRPSAWTPNKVHARGVEMVTLAASSVESGLAPSAHAGAPYILTLAPIDPLEGHATIDPRLATGPFAWRVAPMLTADERARFGLAGPEEIAQLLAEAPPRALFTGLRDGDPQSEADLVQWAAAQGYAALPMRDEGTLHLSPLAAWPAEGATLRLAAHTLPAAPLAPGATLDFVLYLTSDGPSRANLNLLLRATAEGGVELWRDDGWPFGAATSGWLVGATWPSGHTLALPPNAAPGLLRLDAAFYDPATLETAGGAATIGWLVVAPLAPPAPPLATWGETLSLRAAAAPLSARPGETINVELLWHVEQTPAADLTTFLHLAPAAEPGAPPVAQVDAPPAGGLAPTSLWPAGLSQTDALSLALPEDLAPGDYSLLLGLYESATLKRLPVEPAAPSEALPIARVVVSP